MSTSRLRASAALVAGVALLALSAPILAQTKPTEPQPPSCGDLGKDNRPNVCSKLVAGHWHQKASKCEKLGEGKFRYTHCDGSTQEMSGTDLCCSKGTTCPTAGYVATCIAK